MRLTPFIVQDALKDFSPVLHITQGKEFRFTSMRILDNPNEIFCTDIMYIVLSNQFNADTAQDCFFTVIPYDESEYDKLQQVDGNFILLPYGTDTASIANLLFSTFDTLAKWSCAIRTAVLTNQTFQDLIAIGKIFFGNNPIIMTNPTYNILGCSVESVPDNEKVNNVLSGGYYPKETTDGLASMGYQAKGPLYMTPTWLEPPTYMNCPLFVQSFHTSNGTFLGFVTIYFTESKPTAGQFDIFKYFAHEVRDYYYSQGIQNGLPAPSQMELFMADLIEHTYEDEAYLTDRARVLKIPLNASYRLGIIQWDEFSLSQANYVIGRLRSSLDFPYFKVLRYKQSVLVILQGDTPSLKLMEEISEFYAEFQKLLAVCKGYAGFSPVCNSLLKLNVSYIQACAAVQYGTRLDADNRIYFYSKFYIYDMLETYSQKYKLEDMFIQKLRKLENPNEGEYSNLELLRNYMLTERSISCTAKLMHMHRNSVIYRLGKIQEILGIDFNDADVRLRVLISFKILEMINGKIRPLPRATKRADCEQEDYLGLTTHE